MPDRERWDEIGCGDGNCDFRRPTGMHTNAGCRCFPRHADEYDQAERSRLRRWVRVMRDRIAELEEVSDTVTTDRNEWQADAERNRAAYAEAMIRASKLTTALQAAAKLIEAYEAGTGAMQLIEPRGAYHDALEAADV